MKNAKGTTTPVDTSKAVKELVDLQARKDQLQDELTKVDQQIATRLNVKATGTVAKGDGSTVKRAARTTKAKAESKPLGDILVAVLKKNDNQAMSIDDMSAAALKAGHNSKATNHPKVVRELMNRDNRFKKVKLQGRSVGYQVA